MKRFIIPILVLLISGSACVDAEEGEEKTQKALIHSVDGDVYCYYDDPSDPDAGFTCGPQRVDPNDPDDGQSGDPEGGNLSGCTNPDPAECLKEQAEKEAADPEGGNLSGCTNPDPAECLKEQEEKGDDSDETCFDPDGNPDPDACVDD